MPFGNITTDRARFRDIVKKLVKNDLTKYLTHEDLLAKRGNKKINIPIPIIGIPRFKYETRQLGGVAQGDGDIGDPLFDGEEGKGDGAGLGDDGNMEVEMFSEEIENVLIEALGLPHLEPKGNRMVHAQKTIYRGVAEKGTKRRFQQTYKEALKRAAESGGYRPGDPVVPTKRDMRYYAPKLIPGIRSSAVLMYMMDVSGSMGERERRLCRITNTWMQRILGRYYKNLEERFIVHTSDAFEVDGPFFYGTKRGGGTKTSAALEKLLEIMRKDYSPEEWNIYPFYYSDGDNFSDDNDKTIAILGNQILPNVNMFGYAQCSDGGGRLLERIESQFNLNSRKGSEIPKRKIRTATLIDDDDIIKTLRTFLNKDKIPFYDARNNP